VSSLPDQLEVFTVVVDFGDSLRKLKFVREAACLVLVADRNCFGFGSLWEYGEE
jgi:hypothetical protein